MTHKGCRWSSLNLNSHILRFTGALAVLGLTVLSQGRNLEPTSPPSASSIIIGVSNVQSGNSSELGKKLLDGSRAYFNVVNSSGGIRGRKIDLILKDDRYEPDPAVENTNDLIVKDKVFF